MIGSIIIQQLAAPTSLSAQELRRMLALAELSFLLPDQSVTFASSVAALLLLTSSVLFTSVPSAYSNGCQPFSAGQGDAA